MIKKYSDIQPTLFDGEAVKGVAGRVVIGKKDGAKNFCMRVFEIAVGGNTARHSHEWEHEIFVHAGDGEIFLDGRWNTIGAGNAIYVEGNMEHQMRNIGNTPFVFVCLIPPFAPEL